MARWVKILCAAVCSFAVLFSCVGYAAVTGVLTITGSAKYDAPQELVITGVTLVTDQTTAAEAGAAAISPTNVKSTITGSSGDKIVYEITAHNYSPDYKYAYIQANGDSEFYPNNEYVEISKVYVSTGEGLVEYTHDNNILQHDDDAETPTTNDDITFYVEYTLLQDLTDAEVMINYEFKAFIYSVTYYDGADLHGIDYVVDNSAAYNVRDNLTDDTGTSKFNGWKIPGGTAGAIETIAADNTTNYTFFADWSGIYVVYFVVQSGTELKTLYYENFAAGQNGLTGITEDELTALLNEEMAQIGGDLAATWPLDSNGVSYATRTYTETEDITVRANVTYSGKLNLTPVDTDGDGIIDYYEVDAVDGLSGSLEVPGAVGGIPVTVVDDICSDFLNTGLNTVEFGEGVTTINANALAMTSGLTTVYLPSTLTSIGQNAFATTLGGSFIQKKVNFVYSGTVEDWNKVQKASGWESGLATGSTITFSDGTVWELTADTFLGYGTYTWNEKT